MEHKTNFVALEKAGCGGELTGGSFQLIRLLASENCRTDATHLHNQDSVLVDQHAARQQMRCQRSSKQSLRGL